jgi:nitrite reductase/ring-hydroxylating ferredoxin subunit
VQDYWRLRPSAPPEGTLICRLADLPEQNAREYVYGHGPSAFRMFAVRYRGVVHAYLNLCPHASLPLNIRPHAFLAPDRKTLICDRHFAQFEIDTGLCIAGACVGSHLDRIPVHINADRLLFGEGPGR